MSQDATLTRCITVAADWIIEATHVIIFSGAGLSTASGLPDFRGPDGVWTRRDAGLPPPSATVPRDQIKPNAGHLAIVELEKLGKVQFLISQNVDGLHVDSGFPRNKIAELHGNKNLLMCVDCEKKFTKSEIGWDVKRHGSVPYRTQRELSRHPRCPDCGGRIISSVVNFGDPLPEWDLKFSMEHSKNLCDLMIVLGSSLVVNPAARMVHFARKRGARVIINNMGDTPYDGVADMLVAYPINDFFPAVVSRVREKLKNDGDV